MTPPLVLFYFNLMLLVLIIGSESITARKQYRRRSRFFPLAVLRITLLVIASVLILMINAQGLIPPYNPMRLVLTFILLHAAIRDTYDVVANK